MPLGPIFGTEAKVYSAKWNDTYLPAPKIEALSQKIARVIRDVLRGFVVFWLLAQLLRPVIRACILPASWRGFSGGLRKLENELIGHPARAIEFFVMTPDGAKIHALLIAGPGRERGGPPFEGISRAILVHNPDGVSFTAQNSSRPHPLMTALRDGTLPNDTALVFFDHRSVGESCGSFNHCDELIIDALSVRQVVAAGLQINSDYIDCYGQSLGGAVAAVAMARESETASLRCLFSDRSFTSLDAVIKGIAGRILGAFGCYLLSLSGFGTLEPAKALAGVKLDQIYATRHPKDRVIHPTAQMRSPDLDSLAKYFCSIDLPDGSDADGKPIADYHNVLLVSLPSEEILPAIQAFTSSS